MQVSRVDGFQAAPFEQLEIAVSLTPADYGIAVRFVYFVQEKGVVGEKDLDLCVRFSELLFEPCFLGGFLLRIAVLDVRGVDAQQQIPFQRERKAVGAVMLFENGAVDLVAGDLLVVVAGKTDDLDLFVHPGDDRVERPPLLRIVIPVDQIAGHYDQIGFQPVDSPYGFAACFDFAGHLPVVAPVTELGVG